MNKKWIILLAVMTLVFLPAAAQDSSVDSRNGNGGNGNSENGNGGNGNGGTCVYNILVGTPFSFSGTVIDVGSTGDGLVISAADGDLTVTGLGPNRYWDSLKVEKPVVGDTVSGNGYTVDYNGVEKNVLTDITVNGIKVELRDAGGLPLWRGFGGYGNREEGSDWSGGGYGSYTNILAGAPFTIRGDVISANSPDQSGFHGNGLVIATATGNIIVTGLGPYHFWDNLGMDQPAAGDTIGAEGFTVTYKTTEVNVLMAVTLSDGTRIQLRDPETGAPLWRR